MILNNFSQGQSVYMRDKTDAWKVGIVHRVEGDEILVKCGTNEVCCCVVCGVRFIARGRYILKTPAILTIENVTLYYPFKYTSNILLV